MVRSTVLDVIFVLIVEGLICRHGLSVKSKIKSNEVSCFTWKHKDGSYNV